MRHGREPLPGGLRVTQAWLKLNKLVRQAVTWLSVAWLSLGQPSLETDGPSKGLASSTTISKDRAASPVSEHPLWHWAPPAQPCPCLSGRMPPAQGNLPTPPAHCVPPPLRAARGTEFLAHLHSLKVVLIGGPYHGQKTVAQRGTGTWPGEKPGEPHWEDGSPASRPGRAAPCQSRRLVGHYTPWSAFPSAAHWPHVRSPVHASVWFYDYRLMT